MILDILSNAERYLTMHPDFGKAFDFLEREDLAELPEGKHEIEGERLFVSISKGMGRKKEDANLEIHRKYIDIQLVLSGSDKMGWKALSACKQPSTEYNAEKDIRFYKDEPQTWVKVEERSFTIFFPEDAHLPLISDGIIHKVVVKVKCK